MAKDFEQEVKGIVDRASRLGSVSSVFTGFPKKKQPPQHTININITKREV